MICKATKLDGTQCKHKAKVGDFCGRHLPEEKPKRVSEKKVAAKARSAGSDFASSLQAIVREMVRVELREILGGAR